MAKKSVLVSTCDSCSKEVTHDLQVPSKRAEFDLPTGWIHVQGNDKSKELFALDLCDTCSKEVRLFAKSVTKNGKVSK